MIKGARQREWPRHLSTHTHTHNSTSLELSFKSHFVCLYMYVCDHVRTLIVQINMFKPTHTHWTLPTTMSVLETPFDMHVSSVYQTHTCMQAPIPTLCISAKKTHNKGSRTQPIMSTLMSRSGIPVICSRATLSCDSSYFCIAS